MPVKVMNPDTYPGKPPKNIGKKDTRVYQLLGRGCFELLRFKTSADSVYYMVPKMEDGTHISFHPKKIHLKKDGDYSNVNIESFFEANKRFIKFRSPCFCIRIGKNIAADDLDKILPILIKFLPKLNINQSGMKGSLLKRRFIKFKHPRFKPFSFIRIFNRSRKIISDFKNKSKNH